MGWFWNITLILLITETLRHTNYMYSFVLQIALMKRSLLKADSLCLCTALRTALRDMSQGDVEEISQISQSLDIQTVTPAHIRVYSHLETAKSNLCHKNRDSLTLSLSLPPSPTHTPSLGWIIPHLVDSFMKLLVKINPTPFVFMYFVVFNSPIFATERQKSENLLMAVNVCTMHVS